MKCKLLILAILFSGFLMAQDQPFEHRGDRKELREKRQERIENLKIAYLSKQLGLTPEESEKFWPVYNQYEQMLKEARQSPRGMKKPSELTASEADEIINTHIQNEYKRAEIQEQKVKALKPIIGSVRIIQLHHAENKFKKEILNRTDNRSRGNRGDHRGKRK